MTRQGTKEKLLFHGRTAGTDNSDLSTLQEIENLSQGAFTACFFIIDAKGKNPILCDNLLVKLATAVGHPSIVHMIVPSWGNPVNSSLPA